MSTLRLCEGPPTSLIVDPFKVTPVLRKIDSPRGSLWLKPVSTSDEIVPDHPLAATDHDWARELTHVRFRRRNGTPSVSDGDVFFFYASGGSRRVFGVGIATSSPDDDPTGVDPNVAADYPWVVRCDPAVVVSLNDAPTVEDLGMTPYATQGGHAEIHDRQRALDVALTMLGKRRAAW